MLKRVVRRTAAACGFPAREARIFSNSRLPEKPLIESTGIAFRGRNGLAIIPGLGSLFVIAGVILPIERARARDAGIEAAWGASAAGPGAPAAGPLPADPCAGCDACVRACPVKAIARDGAVDAARCLQGLACSAEPFEGAAREAWGSRLYGCQACQDACPWNRGLGEPSTVTLGEIGPSISLRRVLERTPAEVRELFRPTPMGRSWLPPEALIRNALLAAGNSRDPSLIPLVAGHADSPTRAVREAARWARERLGE
jgi:ferredoxin